MFLFTLILPLIIFSCVNICFAQQTTNIISSPDKNIVVSCDVKSATYSISYKKETQEGIISSSVGKITSAIILIKLIQHLDDFSYTAKICRSNNVERVFVESTEVDEPEIKQAITDLIAYEKIKVVQYIGHPPASTFTRQLFDYEGLICIEV